MTGDEALFCTFEAAGRLFGVPIEDIKEVTAEVHCTGIPHTPDCVRGYVNIRGQIILALDLKRLLKLPTRKLLPLRKMIPILLPMKLLTMKSNRSSCYGIIYEMFVVIICREIVVM